MVNFDKNEEMPQEIIEEKKMEPARSTLLDHVQHETRNYLESMKMVALTLEADLADLKAQKLEMEKYLDTLKKHKEI